MDGANQIPFGELTAQYQSIKDEVDAAIGAVLEKGWFILGENVEAFEDEFARYVGARHAIGVGSGTEALHIALLACGVESGDEVLTVPNTAVPTASTTSHQTRKRSTIERKRAAAEPSSSIGKNVPSVSGLAIDSRT